MIIWDYAKSQLSSNNTIMQHEVIGPSVPTPSFHVVSERPLVKVAGESFAYTLSRVGTIPPGGHQRGLKRGPCILEHLFVGYYARNVWRVG
jgi:hypothetical protein